MPGRLVRRRCNDPDHKNLEWVRKSPEVEKQFPKGNFEADLDEERAIRHLPAQSIFQTDNDLAAAHITEKRT